MRWSEDDRWRNEFFTELATLAKDINNNGLKDDLMLKKGYFILLKRPET